MTEREKIIAIIQRGYFTDGDLADALLTELAKVSEPLPPIESDDEMNRYYIPVHPNWEIQTKGTGSSFRIAKRDDSGDRWLVCDKYLHAPLEQMARDIQSFTHPLPQPDLVDENERKTWALLMKADIEQLREQLATAQASETELLKPLERFANYPGLLCDADYEIARAAIAAHKARKDKA